MTASTLDSLDALTNLESLSLCRTKVTNVGLSRLAGLQRLSSLGILECRDVTNKGLTHLRGLKNLKHLSIVHTPVTDVGIESFLMDLTST